MEVCTIPDHTYLWSHLLEEEEVIRYTTKGRSFGRDSGVNLSLGLYRVLSLLRESCVQILLGDVYEECGNHRRNPGGG
jgi:hypothetical protein